MRSIFIIASVMGLTACTPVSMQASTSEAEAAMRIHVQANNYVQCDSNDNRSGWMSNDEGCYIGVQLGNCLWLAQGPGQFACECPFDIVASAGSCDQGDLLGDTWHF